MGRSSSVLIDSRIKEAGSVATERLRTVIIARNPDVCEHFRQLLSNCPAVEVVSDAVTVVEAIGVLKRHNPAIVLFDVALAAPGHRKQFRLGKGVGQLILLFGDDDDGRALADQAGIHCLNVHCSFDDCQRVVHQAVEFLYTHSAEPHATGIIELLTGRPAAPPGRIALWADSAFVLVEVPEISWMESAGERTKVYTQDKLYTTAEKLERIWTRLKKRDFVLIDSDKMVNLNHIAEVRLRPGAANVISLSNHVELTVARGYLTPLLSKLGIRGYPS